MQMTPEYFLATGLHLEGQGFARTIEEDPTELLGGKVVSATRQRLVHEARRLVFDLVRDAAGHVRYFLALEWNGASTFSLPLDSWKYWPDRLEVKFSATPDTGESLSLRLRW